MEDQTKKRLFAIEATKEMSEADIDDLCELFELLQKRYHFRWSATYNPEWLRALANDMEEDIKKVRNGK